MGAGADNSDPLDPDARVDLMANLLGVLEEGEEDDDQDQENLDEDCVIQPSLRTLTPLVWFNNLSWCAVLG
jgi:hypothetical protein